uniref:Alpha 1,4-glycosyltransferase domain-containing protein n=1 Tax=viral metagenome TaxID=1070528 RepID=A0A6C0B172_9ZZZZ
METRNIFLYWVGKEYKLIHILRNLIYLHSKNGKGYQVHLITDENINQYINNIPEYFNKLCYAHQADFVRVNVICDYGGIWLDSDTIVLNSLDSLFDYTIIKDGFFIKHSNNTTFYNGIFGSKKQTPLMIDWKNRIINILNKSINIEWHEIGADILDEFDKCLYNNYEVIDGEKSLFPVHWTECETEFVNKPFDNYKTIIREYQPLIALVRSVYSKIEDMSISEEEILQASMPLNYFINKSLENMLIKTDLVS